MNFTLLNWIKTDYWEGALIEDVRGKQYLSNGINKWEVTPYRKFEVVESINENQFCRYWNEYFPYSSLTK